MDPEEVVAEGANGEEEVELAEDVYQRIEGGEEEVELHGGQRVKGYVGSQS